MRLLLIVYVVGLYAAVALALLAWTPGTVEGDRRGEARFLMLLGWPVACAFVLWLLVRGERARG